MRAGRAWRGAVNLEQRGLVKRSCRLEQLPQLRRHAVCGAQGDTTRTVGFVVLGASDVEGWFGFKGARSTVPCVTSSRRP